MEGRGEVAATRARSQANVAPVAAHAPPPPSLLVQIRLSPEIPTRIGSESSTNGPSTAGKRLRRAGDLSGSDGVDPDAGETSDSSSNSGTQGSTRVAKSVRVAASQAKPRRPAYSTLQKQERDALAKELKLLEAQADLLREHAGLASTRAADMLKQTDHENRLLQDARRAQLLWLCGMRSEISSNLREQFGVPLSIPIRLCADPIERRSTLLGVRRTKLNRAYDYLEERFRGVDLTRRYRDQEFWTSADGDFCGISSDIMHFRGVKSVKQVYDAFLFYMTNMEISISEALGQLTLREDIDSVDTSISNHRLVSSTDHGLVMEMNIASFGEYHERFRDHHNEEFALFSADFVEEDALHPYSPYERVRKDIIGAVAMSPLWKNNELVVVMRRAAYLKIWRPQFCVSDAALDDLEANVGAWGDVMFQSMRDTLSAAS